MDMRTINEGVIAEFRENDGALTGPMEGAPILLLTTIGRRSGRPHTTPLGFVEADGKLVVAAANGGADADPDWFANIVHHDRVRIEVPGASVSASAEIATGGRRVDLLTRLEASLPGMSDHLAATDREVPVVVFTERISEA